MPQTGTTTPAFGFGALADDLHQRALAVHIGFIDVGDVEHLLGGDQSQRFDELSFVGIELQAAHGFAFVEDRFALAEQLAFDDRFLVAAAGEALGFVERAADGFQVGQGEFGVDRVDVADGIDGAFDVDDVPAAEAADDVEDGVDLADVGEELVAEPLTGAGAADDAGDIDDAHLGGDDFFGVDVNCVDDVEPLIGDADDADVGLDGGERVVRRQRPGGGQRVKQSALADVGQPDDANF